ncbi:MAG: molybdopterin-dependent oxidoreductase [Desulfurococcales archaeon]|nr:molybdopterin-dependent oxidoreductase [Desulfurococcales archaeon]
MNERSELSGCAVYHSPFNRPLGIPYSFECAFTTARVGDSYHNIVLAVQESVGKLEETIGVPLEIGGLEGWEYSGRMFNLYMYSLTSRGRRAGQIRAVEVAGHLLGAYGVLTAETLRPVRPKNKRGLLYSWGYTPGPIYLRPVGGKEPPGQKVVSRNPIYAVEGIQDYVGEWALRIEGLVEKPLHLTLEDLYRMADEQRRADFHCVTGWSLKGKMWEGASLKETIKLARPKPGARWLAAVSSGGYTAVMPLDIALESGLLVLKLDGKPLTREMGAPLRLFVPELYGWKHVKWLTRLVLLEEYTDGYWEALAYHERGLAAAIERFKVRNLEIAERGELPEGARMLKPPGLR